MLFCWYQYIFLIIMKWKINSPSLFLFVLLCACTKSGLLCSLFPQNKWAISVNVASNVKLHHIPAITTSQSPDLTTFMRTCEYQQRRSEALVSFVNILCMKVLDKVYIWQWWENVVETFHELFRSCWKNFCLSQRSVSINSLMMLAIGVKT